MDNLRSPISQKRLEPAKVPGAERAAEIRERVLARRAAIVNPQARLDEVPRESAIGCDERDFVVGARDLGTPRKINEQALRPANVPGDDHMHDTQTAHDRACRPVLHRKDGGPPPPVPAGKDRAKRRGNREARMLPPTLTIRVALHHETRYAFDRPVEFGPHVVRLRPAPHCRTPILAHTLRVTPAEHFLNWQQDPFGNFQARIVFLKPGTQLRFEVDLVAEMTVVNPFDFFLEEDAKKFPFSYAPSLKRDLRPYLQATPESPLLADFVERARSSVAVAGRNVVDVLVELNQRVNKVLRYDIRMEPGVFTPDETLRRGHGSCRDFAWLLVQSLRGLGFAARFVSGYSIQLKPDEKPLEGPAGVAEDSADLHAWAEVFLPGAGWVGLDATSGLLAGEGHIPLACTPDPETAAAITGSFSWNKRDEAEQVKETFSFAMSVRRLYEVPRTTAPYTEEAWGQIARLGNEVEGQLASADVRLTMGGEPTFVAVTDPDAPEWNIEALGPTKRRYATNLLWRLYEKFTPHGLVHEGQGKWYPGEPLPRWALSAYFRKDGLPIWKDPALFARAETGSASPADAHRFLSRVSEVLGVDAACALPGHEDAWYYLWRERRLPTNVDPFESQLSDESERARLAKIFDNGLSTVVGYALPLRCVELEGERRWESGKWFLRRERMYLTPGDSPMGYRLPLDSLPWAAPNPLDPGPQPPEPFAAYAPLPSRERLAAVVTRQWPDRAAPSDIARARLQEARPQEARQQDARPPEARPQDAPRDVVRTALCVEPRGGVLHVFMPPLETAEGYLALCAAIESTALDLGMTVRIEGYLPPADPRLGRLQITPDPGVIEVNIQPAHNWDELVSNTSVLYTEARASGLRAEKFMLDGRHSGTGGGNHVVLGGATAPDSPILRRPDILKSLVQYWLNHPSLSYLFSGLFVGPTSQAPRVDEARNDSLYELELAFAEMAAKQSQGLVTPPWLVDRLLRNLLTDVTGNTHRTEFCIDKLYSPDGPAGRQGLVELRSFEMPPHPRMSLTQQLVVRALVASFWQAPYRIPAVHWGTELHDRFLLPHFVRRDFEEVLGDLSRAGYRFDPAWFAPHYEFRFPELGSIVAPTGLTLELRQAIEPWHVLGEEASGGGVARYVDSSVERLQVMVRGMVDGRHVIACNGRRVPLKPTGTNGERVAGVRYRAWCPPSALHPTIGVHAPLTFDVIDTWNDRAVAGCRYHVSHPGGLAHLTFPQNSFEAESRRASRFWPFGHTGGPSKVPAIEDNPLFPYTLDLRRTSGS